MMEQYRNRWQEVVAIENREQRQASFSQRWHRLNSIIRMAATLKLEPEEDVGQDRIVSQRWNDLRELYLTEVQGK